MKKTRLAIAIGASIPVLLGLGVFFIFSQVKYLSAAQNQEATVSEKNSAEATEQPLDLPACAPDHLDPIDVSQWKDEETEATYFLVIGQSRSLQKETNSFIYKVTSSACEIVDAGRDPWTDYMPNPAAIALKTIWWKHISETEEDFVENWLDYPENWDSMPFYPEDEKILSSLGFKISEKAARANSYQEFLDRWQDENPFYLKNHPNLRKEPE